MGKSCVHRILRKEKLHPFISPQSICQGDNSLRALSYIKQIQTVILQKPFSVESVSLSFFCGFFSVKWRTNRQVKLSCIKGLWHFWIFQRLFNLILYFLPISTKIVVSVLGLATYKMASWPWGFLWLWRDRPGSSGAVGVKLEKSFPSFPWKRLYLYLVYANLQVQDLSWLFSSFGGIQSTGFFCVGFLSLISHRRFWIFPARPRIPFCTFEQILDWPSQPLL